MVRQKLYWRLNERIHAPMVRVIDENGKQIGVLKKEEALAKAKKAGMDLIEIAPKAKPPVAKIADFGKFKYREEKKLRAQKSKSKTPELKEIRFSPFIGDADYQTRLERVKEFLSDKDKVRLVVKFKGRQMGSKQFGYSLLRKVLEEFGDKAAVDMEPKFLGRHLVMIISPTSKGKKDKETEDAEAKNAPSPKAIKGKQKNA